MAASRGGGLAEGKLSEEDLRDHAEKLQALQRRAREDIHVVREGE